MADFDILNEILDSQNFTVGGGAAAALAGAMAAGLIAMVARLSVKKEYGLSQEQYHFVIEQGDMLAKELMLGTEEDKKAFLKIKNAYALPKGTEEERFKRAIAIENGGIAAAAVPKDNGFMCKKVYELGMLLLGQSNPNAKSDLEEAIMLAKAGMLGCALNIEANLSLIKDGKLIGEFKRAIDALKAIEVQS